MKKNIYNIFIIILLIFSFFYTNKVIEYLKKIDPLMQEIKSKEEKYNINPINAIINGNEITSGKNGKTIDYDKTYNKMKKYGTYNESLTTLKEVKPTITIENNYDKYIVGGNSNNTNISLVFIVNNNSDIEKILNILNNKKVTGTFFIDATLIEKNTSIIKNNLNHEYELLSYNSDYKESIFKTSLSYLETITSKKSKYCYTKNDNDNLLNLCKKLKLHTIKPTYHLSKNIYKKIKNNLDNSIILSFDVNNYVVKELPLVIDLIRSKGYKCVKLDTLISESY